MKVYIRTKKAPYLPYQLLKVHYRQNLSIKATVIVQNIDTP